MKNKVIKAAAAAFVATGAFMASGWSFFNLTVRGGKRKKEPGKRRFELSHTRVNHPRHQFEREYETGRAWCRQQRMQDCYLSSRDGLTLHGFYLPCGDPVRIVLLCHGYKGTPFGNFANIARFLHENHCDLLFIDQRCCGESGGRYITFGALEQYDVLDWASFLAGRWGGKLPIYLYGMSMGASSVLMASGHELPGDVKGLIADCGFRSMRGQLQDMAAGWFHLRWIGLTLFREQTLCRAVAHFDMRDADTAKAMETNHIPVLFFHGLKDTYVLPQNSITNHRLCQAPKELVLVPEARHLSSCYVAPELYRSKLLEFFERYDKSGSPRD